MQNLVTGATGFTGGHLARALVERGEGVRALVRPGRDVRDLAAAGIEIVEGELTRAADVRAAAAGCDRIYHLAAVFRTAGHPDNYYRDVNVGGTVNVLEAARALGCERVVHCSTGGVHGHVEEPPADESYRTKPGDIYQETKLEAELQAREAIAQGQPVAIFRPGAIYGEGDLRFLKLFKAVQKGHFVMVGSGDVRLHMVHIDDLVQAIVLCGTESTALGEVFLVAGREAPTLNEIVAAAAATAGVRPPRWRVPLGPVYALAWLCERVCVPLGVEPPLHRRRVGFFSHHREFDIGKAERLLGYRPRVSVREGIARTIDWYVREGLMTPITM
jgi:nucleoside-diphosphate-sugar epimerase